VAGGLEEERLIIECMRRTEKRTRPGLDDLEPKILSEKELESVKGGKTPSPGGPIPLPYPNTTISSDIPSTKK